MYLNLKNWLIFVRTEGSSIFVIKLVILRVSRKSNSNDISTKIIAYFDRYK